MRIEKSLPYTLKVQINDDNESPITSGTFYIKFKRNSDNKYWDGAQWIVADGDYLVLTHDMLGTWEHTLPAIALVEEGQYTVFFNNESNPRIYTSLDLEIIQTLNYWTAAAS